MKTPSRIQPLVTDGLVDSVLRQLMSGKEAMVYVVQCGDEIRCAKVYKEANKRSFRQAVDYTEGRKTKNSRQARAMQKRLALRPAGAGSRLATCRSRCALPPRRRRRPCANTLQFPRRRPADGVGG